MRALMCIRSLVKKGGLEKRPVRTPEADELFCSVWNFCSLCEMFCSVCSHEMLCIVCSWWVVLQCEQLMICFALCAADELLVVCEMFCSVCSWQNVLHCVQLTTCFALCATGECLGLCAAHDLFKLHCVQLTEWFCCMCRLRNAFQCAADKWFCSACSLQNI